MMKPSVAPKDKLFMVDTVRQTLVVLASDDGTELLRLLEAVAQKQIDAIIALVVTDSRGSRAQDRAEDHGIPTLFHPFDWYLATGRTAQDYDQELAQIIAAHQPDRVLISGWERPFSSQFVERFHPQPLADYLALP